MSWIPNSATASHPSLPVLLKIGAAIALAGAALGATTAQAAIIVVRSNGPSASTFPPGKSLATGSAITLRAGDVITILDASGTRVLRGPGKVPVTGGAQASVNGIAALIADTGARQSRVGATRGAVVAPTHPTNVWSVDITRGGNFCVGNVQALALWRADSSQAASLTVMPAGTGGARVQIDFRPGQAVAAWPLASLPVSDGSQFRIAGTATPAPVTITTRLLGASPASLDAAAQALLDHGCSGQLDMLVAATTDDPGS